MPAAAQTLSQKVPLTYRTLGKTGLKVTSLSFGCMTTSDASVIERAADLGIIHFDTARSYQSGNNERMVGAALKSRRKRSVISSKSGGQDREGGPRRPGHQPARAGNRLPRHLVPAQPRTSPAEVTDDLLEAQRIAKKAGKIRFAGVSTHFNMDRMLAHLVKLGQTDVVLTTYNFAMRNVATANQPRARRPT